MACELRAYIVDRDDTIKVAHSFYGEDEEECENLMQEHLRGCSYFSAAEADGRLITEFEEIDDDERPDPEDFEEEEDADELEEEELEAE